LPSARRERAPSIARSRAVQVTPLALPDVVRVEPRVARDARGWFYESWSGERFAQHGLPDQFVQDNVSRSERGVLRGLHLQHPFGQGKLVSVLHGEVFDVAVDVRRGSPTFGRWCGEQLGAEPGRQLYVPVGFAHGFVVLSDSAVVAYKVTERYHPETELTIAWDDPDIGVEWPLSAAPSLSPKDAAAPRLRDVDPERLPSYPAADARPGATPRPAAAEMSA
jgi:dTDP-4-dehydrorhamnose 3,5-epimerase